MADAGEETLKWLAGLDWTGPVLMLLARDAVIAIGYDELPGALVRLKRAGIRIRHRCFHPGRNVWLLGIGPWDLARAKRALKGAVE